MLHLKQTLETFFSVKNIDTIYTFNKIKVK